MPNQRKTDRVETDPDAEFVARMLGQIGLVVDFIPPTDKHTCDLLARDDGETYFVEVKGFRATETTSEPASRLSFRPRLPIGLVRHRSTKANRQIRSTANQYGDGLRLQAWIRHSEQAPQLGPMILGTLYGARIVGVISADSVSSEYTLNMCLFYSHSDFFKHRERLDGVMVLEKGRAELHVNDHSERAARLRVSALGRILSERNALRDATWLVNQYGYLIADCGADRNNEDAIHRYLMEKYKLKRIMPIISLGFDWDV